MPFAPNTIRYVFKDDLNRDHPSRNLSPRCVIKTWIREIIRSNSVPRFNFKSHFAFFVITKTKNPKFNRFFVPSFLYKWRKDIFYTINQIKYESSALLFNTMLVKTTNLQARTREYKVRGYFPRCKSTRNPVT